MVRFSCTKPTHNTEILKNHHIMHRFGIMISIYKTDDAFYDELDWMTG